MLVLLQKEKGESARDYAIRVIKYNIIHLYLKPGQQVSEGEIAGYLSMSRTPIREAFINLGKDGIITTYPQKYSAVSLIDMKIVEEARFVRCTLEAEICKMACGNLNEENILALEESIRLQELYKERSDWENFLEQDNQFHKLIYYFCDKERTYHAIENLTCHFDRIRALSLMAINISPKIQDHYQMIEAIKNGDRELMGRVHENHLLHARRDEVILRKKFPHYYVDERKGNAP